VGYFFHGSILDGLVLTLWLTAAVMTCGFPLVSQARPLAISRYV